MAMIEAIDNGIEYALNNPGRDSHRELFCYAALDMSLGHVLRDRRRDPAWFGTEAQQDISEVMPASGTCGILDTTTVVNAFCILSENEPVASLPPGSIFDLATFVSACIFEDNVVFLANRRVSTNDIASLLDELPVRELPWGSDSGFSVIVENTWGEAERYAPALFNHPNWRAKYVEHWSALVGESLDLSAASWPGDYRRYFSSIDSVAIESAIVGHDPGDDHLTTVFDLAKGFVTESSVRAVFYSVLANAIGATYHASSFRTRLREMIYEQAAHTVVTDTMEILKRLDEAFHQDIAKDDLVISEVEVPFALSAALAGVTTCSELCENVMKLRGIAAPLRAKRAELALAWRNQEQASVHALLKAVTNDARRLADCEFFAGHGLMAKLILSPGGARPTLGALGRLLLCFSKLPKEVQEVLRQRCVRPELWAVSRLSAQARRVINCLDPLYELLKPKGLVLSPIEASTHLEVLRRLAT